MPTLVGTTTALATTNAYVSALKMYVPPHIPTIVVQIKENNTNAIKYKILVSEDDVTYFEYKPETVVIKNGSDFEPVIGAWLWIDVQVVASVAGAQGSVTIKGMGGHEVLMRGETFKAGLEDPDGTLNVFETDQAATDTPTLTLPFLNSVSLLRGVLDRVHIRLNQANAVTANLYILAGTQADDYQSENRLLFSSLDYVPAGLVSTTEYDFVDLKIPFVLDTPATFYYLLDWSGAPGNTPGYLSIFGRR
jgi:hypothetical protein